MIEKRDRWIGVKKGRERKRKGGGKRDITSPGEPSDRVSSFLGGTHTRASWGYYFIDKSSLPGR